MLLPTEQYDTLLQQKADKLQQLLSPFNAPALTVFASAPEHFRMRAEFRVWHEGDDLFHIMFDQQTRQRKRIDSFPQGSQLINQMMQTLIPLLKENHVLRHRLFQIDYLSTQSNKIIVSLLSHKV